MKRIITSCTLVVLLSALSIHAIAQEKIYWEDIAKFKNEGINNSQVMDIIGYLTDVTGPRLTGSPNMRNAQQWAKKKMEEFGLKDVRIEEAGEHGVSWDNEYTSLHMMTPDYQPLFGYSKAFAPGTNGKVTGAAAIVSIQTQSDLDKYRGKLRGKFALILPMRRVGPRFTPDANRLSDEQLKELSISFEDGSLQPQPNRNFQRPEVSAQQRLDFLKNEGVAVVLDHSFRGGDGTVFAQGRTGSRGNRGYDAAINAIPQVSLSDEHYNRIYRILERGIPVTLEMEIKNTLRADDSKYYNVIGEIPGTDLKDEIVMIGAHFDSWHTGTGATDNASGSSVVMEAMRILKATGVQPRRTIRIGLWSYEEGGLNGSREYVKKYFGNPRDGKKEAYDKFAGYFNMDNGTGQFRGVWLQGNEYVRPIFMEWMKPFHDYKMNTLSIRNTGGTDHLSFDRAGLPGWQFIQDRIDYSTRTHHSNMDVYDSLIPEDLMINSVIMASFAYQAAMRDQKLPRKQ